MLLPELDIRTLVLIVTFVCLFCSIAFVCFGLTQHTSKGFYTLSAASAFFALGMYLLGWRTILPDAVTIVLANSIILTGQVCLYEGVRRFIRPELNNYNIVFSSGILLLAAALLWLFTYDFRSVNHRIIVITLITFLLSSLAAWEIIKHTSKPRQLSELLLAYVLIYYALFQLFRFTWTVNETQIQEFMDAGTVHALAFLSILVLFLGVLFSSVWLVNQRLITELINKAHHDPLTHILNRRGIDLLASKFFGNTQSHQPDFITVLMDIDHFKHINDNYGHSCGDEVLVNMAALIKQHVRQGDVIGRIGGEEFLILMPNTKLAGGLEITERLRQLIEKNTFTYKSKSIKVTASFGLTDYLPQNATLDQLIPIADKALYLSKDAGRNRATHLSGESLTLAF